jgi:NAD(P)-dependent dehydrogenase (short-subunit alcohol dehydrogenase family)
MPNYPQKVPQQDQAAPGKEENMHPRPIIIREDYRGSGKLKDRKALITGADSGIGRAVAVHFAREGADVTVVYREQDDDAVKTRELVKREGGKCQLIKKDIRSWQNCQQCVEEALSAMGKVDILVNNAGEQHPHDNIDEMDLEMMEATFRTNIFAMMQMCKAALPYMHKGNSIINSSSVTAYRGSSHLLDYASTKGAIISFTRSLSQNLAGQDIRVNAVAPGPIWTPLIPSTFDDLEKFGKQVPMQRPGQPAEVAPAYVFLASEDASYITGQTLHINGGEMIGG